jgi:hypothetical protein
MKKIKFNWGTGIAVSIAIFMIGSITEMLFFMNHDVDLVTDNYYEKTLVYQEQIEIQKRSADLSEEIKINYNDDLINLTFPQSFYGEINYGEIFFYRPSDSKKDFKIPLRLNNEGIQAVSASKMLKGYWKIDISWNMKKQKYQIEKSLFIN